MPPLPTKRASTAALSVYTRQLATMVGVGVGVVHSLEFLSRGDDRVLNAAFARAAQDVSTGFSLSQSMQRMTRVFPGYYVGLVRVGEESGTLHEVLLHLAQYLEKSVGMQRRMVSALAYPAVLLIVSLALIWLLSFYLLPSMTPLFHQLGVPLPWLTRVVLALTSLVTSPVAILAAGFALIAAGLGARQLAEAEEDSALRRGWDRLRLALPWLGPLLRFEISARLMRMLSLTVGLGLDLYKALQLLEGSAGNLIFSERLAAARKELREGVSLSEALRMHAVFPRTAPSVLRVGEETGRISDLSKRLADMYEDEFSYGLDRLASLLEPILLVGTSLVVGTLCIATFLPWITLLSRLA